ncbi:MAG: M23 family metallopeptidase [Thermoleophilia bacterium]|nr:M23 family metallopeptidase [Thermoleophilia bacterium]MDH4340686.1 M23 family metallopeptidase [Thermoleophilia bacterium]MDH5280134.1 M23 family metallopeptidase [Thermoleophilia bacterium]
MIRLVATAAVALVVSATLASAAPPPKSADTESTAVLVRLTVPGQDTVSLGELQWPTSTTSDVQSFQYPDDGSIISLGRSRGSVFAQPGDAAAAQSFAEVIVLSLFGGEVVAARVTASASAGASARSVGADVSASEVQGLGALGRDVSTAPGSTASLEDWGSLSVLSVSSGTRKSGPPGAQGSVDGLRVRLTADHGGLPAGSEILVGSVQATAVAKLSAAPPASTTNPRPPVVRPTRPAAPEPDVGDDIPGGPVLVAPEVSARFTGGGYVFPVYGTASFGDSFGGPRPNVPGGWHHGEDIFAAAGTPLLAVADGTLHTIGFNKIGGYRLWLRDTAGNEFYYAHLSAYSPLAVEGRRVEAGDVIGFVGDTGDADGGAPHLHFEIHPAAMAGLGYDGVVAPYPILLAWRRADDVSFAAGRVYIPSGPGSATLPPPGAVLLQADDIGSTSGLVPGALERALSPSG